MARTDALSAGSAAADAAHPADPTRVGEDRPFAILEFPDTGAADGGLLFCEPVDIIEAWRLHEVRPALAAVERAAARGLHAVGFVSYEAGPAFDAALGACAPGRVPLVWFGLFRAPREEAGACAAEPAGTFRLAAWSHDTTRERYDIAVASIRDAIGRGEVYQVNHTFRLRAGFQGDARAFHRRMLAAQDGGYGAYLDLGRYRVLSASPELFFRRRGARLETRPMKGTARRGRWPAEDEEARRRLAHSAKDRAENLMIVDLVRNDLGRVARLGTVEVPRLFKVERYPTIFQMTSTVTAELAPGTSLDAIFRALFPCGSVTGAPKIAATRRIAALETSPREVYCGAIGWVRPGGDCDFSVAIRTAWLDVHTGRLEYGVGGAVTWDSMPEREYDEALAKAALVHRPAPSFELLETLRLEDGGYVRLERHLDRLAASAAYFGWSDPRADARAALLDHAGSRCEGRHRVRLLVGRAGDMRVESDPIAGDVSVGRRDSAAALPVAVSADPVSRDDRFLFHKTTHRQVYDRRRARHADAFDVLLVNDRGEVTEFTRGNVVVLLDGALCTPPLDCGLLAGAFRAELLDEAEIRERVLRVEDLERVEAVWLINSVREWVPVRIVR